MTTGNSPALPPEEQARRRNLVASADWSCRMEGLGTPSAERVARDESWITGQISRDEYEARAFALVRERIDLAQIRALQARAKAEGFTRRFTIDEEKVFMDELSGEQIEVRDSLTMLTPQQIDQARTWWASLPETEKEIRREHSEKLRRNFGIPLPEGEDGWAAVCYEDENS